VRQGVPKPKATIDERRAKKLACFELLADSVSISEAARITGVNKGTISRYRKSAEFAAWLADKSAAPTLADFPPQHNRQGVTLTDNPEQRGRFLQALKVCGRIEVAAAYSQAHPSQIAAWLVDGAGDISAALAEAYLRAAQVLANLMAGKDPDGNRIEVKPGDMVRAAVEFVKLTDFGKLPPQPLINIDLTHETQALQSAKAVDPMTVIDDALRQQWAQLEHVDLMADGND
jgi:hypothetical protein